MGLITHTYPIVEMIVGRDYTFPRIWTIKILALPPIDTTSYVMGSNTCPERPSLLDMCSTIPFSKKFVQCKSRRPHWPGHLHITIHNRTKRTWIIIVMLSSKTSGIRGRTVFTKYESWTLAPPHTRSNFCRNVSRSMKIKRSGSICRCASNNGYISIFLWFLWMAHSGWSQRQPWSS